MSALGGVTADELVRALSRRHTTLPAEIGAFVVLEACESMLLHGPREVAALTHVMISEAGAIALSGAACDDETGARCLRRVHVALRAAAGPSAQEAQPDTLAALDERPSLRALRDHLEASLVPLNRNASRRVLARLAREAAFPPVGRDDVDPALRSLIGVGAHPANDVDRAALTRTSAPDVSPLQVDLFEGLDLEAAGMRQSAPQRDGTAPALGAVPTRSIRPSYAPRPAAPESFHSLRASADEVPESDPALPGSRKMFLAFSFIALAAAAVALALSVRTPQAHDSFSPLSSLDATGGARGELVVRVTEPNAQVLELVGEAPLEVPDLAVGRAHEFVATAAGHRPARVLVPATADWEPAPEGARYEVALQLEPASNELEARAFGPSRFTEGGSAASTTGTVRVVTTPRGARVYRLLGFSPELHLPSVAIRQHELLVYRDGFVPVTHAVKSEDFVTRDGKRVAEVDVKLEKR
ncbi:MAG: hypothetical protein ABW252_12190 [Polyangiales bacterium]